MKSGRIRVILPPLSVLETAFVALAILLVLLSWYLFVSRYSSLPEKIPMRFDFSGNVSSYGSKGLLVLGPILGTVSVLLLLLLAKVPQLHNYPVKLTEENAPRLYALSRQTLLLLAPGLAAVFCEMTRSMSEGPAGNKGWIAFNSLALLAFLLGGLAVQILRMFRAAKGPQGPGA